MRKQFQVHLGQTSGEYFVTAVPSPDHKLGFYFVKRTRQDAIDAACQGISTYLRNVAKTAPKSAISIDKVQKYTGPVHEAERPKKVQKFGGVPIKKVTPAEVITVSVEV